MLSKALRDKCSPLQMVNENVAYLITRMRDVVNWISVARGMPLLKKYGNLAYLITVKRAVFIKINNSPNRVSRITKSADCANQREPGDLGAPATNTKILCSLSSSSVLSSHPHHHHYQKDPSTHHRYFVSSSVAHPIINLSSHRRFINLPAHQHFIIGSSHQHRDFIIIHIHRLGFSQTGHTNKSHQTVWLPPTIWLLTFPTSLCPFLASRPFFALLWSSAFGVWRLGCFLGFCISGVWRSAFGLLHFLESGVRRLGLIFCIW